MNAKEILTKIADIVGVTPVELSAKTETEMETVNKIQAEEVVLAEETKEEDSMPADGVEEPVKEEKLAIEDIVAALDERLKVIEEAIAKLLKEEKSDEVEVEPVMDMKKEQMMSSQKKFTGAPTTQDKNQPLVNMSKGSNIIDRVMDRLNNYNLTNIK